MTFAILAGDIYFFEPLIIRKNIIVPPDAAI